MKETTTRKAVVLLSGGVDSTTTLAIARNEGFEAYALTFRYGQRHTCEIDAARETARYIGVAGTSSSTSTSGASAVRH